jgi:hypothetical protein
LWVWVVWFGVGGWLRVEVSNEGPAAGSRPWTQSCSPEEHGRGHVIVDALARAHGSHLTLPGSTWWADLPTEAD